MAFILMDCKYHAVPSVLSELGEEGTGKQHYVFLSSVCCGILCGCCATCISSHSSAS